MVNNSVVQFGRLPDSELRLPREFCVWLRHDRSSWLARLNEIRQAGADWTIDVCASEEALQDRIKQGVSGIVLRVIQPETKPDDLIQLLLDERKQLIRPISGQQVISAIAVDGEFSHDECSAIELALRSAGALEFIRPPDVDRLVKLIQRFGESLCPVAVDLESLVQARLPWKHQANLTSEIAKKHE